mgnify:CR=1 FL=1|tara:strand:- start:2232 stop:2858 length:627 start_codon:yes stop_codon:yes gene_type:complete
MFIGIDFDNTIARYEAVFSAVAIEEGLLTLDEADTKREIRDRIKKQENGEQVWMRLQGLVYGKYMARAELMQGCSQFLQHCRKKSVDVAIISHKTEFGHFDPSKTNLRSAAMNWLEEQGFFEPGRFGIDRTAVYFEATRRKKVDRIRALACSHFIDDLEEVFLEPGFPTNTKAHLLTHGHDMFLGEHVVICKNWQDVETSIFGTLHEQ